MKKYIYKFLQIILTPKQYAKFVGVTIGENCIISTKHFGSEPFLITLGNGVHITKGVQFVNHDGGVHVFRKQVSSFDVFGKIVINDGTYIGNNVLILPGVYIGKDCIVGANTVVTKSIPDNCVVAGNPCRYISSTSAYYEKIIIKNAETKGLVDNDRKEKILNLPEMKFIKKVEMKCDL